MAERARPARRRGLAGRPGRDRGTGEAHGHGRAGEVVVSGNPFLGPQPYRAGDSHRFLGRDPLLNEMVLRILARECVTLYGPSGAGKSSLMQAGVIPHLEKTRDFRTVRIDGWPTEEQPLERLVQTLFKELALEPLPKRESLQQELKRAVDLFSQRSDRPLLIYLDQLEQLFLPGQDPKQAGLLLHGLHVLALQPVRGLHLVLSLREDYLGLFQAHAYGRKELLDHRFRLGPFTVGEMVQVACQLASSGGAPQHWSEDEIFELMLQVRVPGHVATDGAEVQTTFAQIVCRALYEKRAKGDANGPVQAEPMLHQYLETTLEGLGPLKPHARRLLEEHLVSNDGSRRLLKQHEARAALRELSDGQVGNVLTCLESAAVLHAEEHQGSRYFELGHDWLARKVFDLRQERVRQEQEERARKIERELAARRRLVAVASVSTAVALMASLLFLWALRQREAARQAEMRARDHALMSGARELLGLDKPEVASKLLLEVAHPERVSGWHQLALDTLLKRGPIFTLRCNGQVAAPSLSPNGQLIAALCSDGRVQIWQSDGKGAPLLLQRHEELRSVVFSHDGQRVVTRSSDKTALVWKTDGKSEPIVLRGHEGDVYSAAFSPDGQLVVTASSDKTARVWRADGTGEPIVLRGHEAEIYSASFSPDGQRIVTTSADNTARVWNTDGKGDPVVLPGHEGGSPLAVFSPDGHSVLVANGQGVARVWRADGQEKPVVLQGHQGGISHAEFSPDGQRVVTASLDGTARVWRADGKGEPIVLQGHEDFVRSAEFSPDGQRIVTASFDGTARVWRADGKGEPIVLQNHGRGVYAAAFSPNGQSVISNSYDGTARVWNVDRRRDPVAVHEFPGAITSVAFSRDWKDIAVVFAHRPALVLRFDTTGKPYVVRRFEGGVNSVAISPDGRTIVTGSNYDGTVRIWRPDEAAEPVVLGEQESGMLSVAFSPDGQEVVTASDRGPVRVWSVEGKRTSAVLSPGNEPITSVALSPDGQRVGIAYGYGEAQVWRIDGQGNPVTLQGSRGVLESIEFSPDGQRVVTASNDGTARVWRTDGAGEPVVLRGHARGVLSATFSPDGLRVATASQDKTARVWRIDGKEEPIVLHGHDAEVISVAFSLDGQRVITASSGRRAAFNDNTIRVWPIGTAELQRLLREANIDCLLPVLRQTYLDESPVQARERYEACERSYGRPPFFTADP
ncbi:eIF2A-related protein [Archangium lansingense]|uniref:nSTAND1 domain-containing NTPase n=1 Tax=Archangium lansingense TaxID=2995310 RepID=UPI003B765344